MSSFNLIIYSPLRHLGELHYANTSEASDAGVISGRLHFSQERLYEPIFVWSPEVDVWSGINDEKARLQLKSLFLDSFQPGLSAEEREFPKLKEVLVQLRTTTQAMQSSSWLPTAQMTTDSDRSDFALYASPTVAFVHFLEWLYETFQHVPGLVLIAR